MDHSSWNDVIPKRGKLKTQPSAVRCGQSVFDDEATDYECGRVAVRAVRIGGKWRPLCVKHFEECVLHISIRDYLALQAKAKKGTT